jgi:hypothetical protein
VQNGLSVERAMFVSFSKLLMHCAPPGELQLMAHGFALSPATAWLCKQPNVSKRCVLTIISPV